MELDEEDSGHWVSKAGWKARVSNTPGRAPTPKTNLEALTILTQVQLGQAPAIKGLLEDGAVVTVTHGVQVHGFVVHLVLKQQRHGQHESGGWVKETRSQLCGK